MMSDNAILLDITCYAKKRRFLANLLALNAAMRYVKTHDARPKT